MSMIRRSINAVVLRDRLSQLTGDDRLDASAIKNIGSGFGGGGLTSGNIDTLAELNAIVTDATLIDTNDSRLSDSRTPTTHNHPATEISDSTAIGRSLITATDAADARGDLSLNQTLNTVTDGGTGTVTFDIANGTDNLHTVTLGGNRTLALSNVDVGNRFIIRITQDGTGTRVPTWWSTINWADGGTAPTLTTTANKTDVFGFICTAANTFDGFVLGQNI